MFFLETVIEKLGKFIFGQSTFILVVLQEDTIYFLIELLLNYHLFLPLMSLRSACTTTHSIFCYFILPNINQEQPFFILLLIPLQCLNSLKLQKILMQIGTMQQLQEAKYYNPIFHSQSSSKQLKIYCASGHLIQTVCVEYKCSKTSPHCLREDCSHCYGMHPFCKTTPLWTFQQFIRNNEEKQLQLWNIVYSAEQKMIKNIQDHHQRLLKDIGYQGLPNKSRETFMSIFRDKKFSHLTGMDFESLKEEIKRFQPVDKTQQIRQLCEEMSQEVDTYLKDKQAILTSFQGNQPIISKIIDKQEDIKFIFSSLGSPKRLELLYRGSQNQFLAAKFHQKCDGIHHTFTLVKTQFQQIIAGYTPLKWSSPSSWAYFSDTSKKSFLLQVNLREKYSLAEDLYSIYCHQSHGPRFGRADLMIPNKCHQNNCTGNFPTSYHSLGKQQNSQQSYTAFSGSPNGFVFRALEYEVFRVIF